MEEIKTLAEFGVTKHEKVLDNGLQTIFIEKPFSPIYAKIVIGAGSVFNPSDNGLAHMAEHLLAGSKNTSKEEFHRIIESIGGFKNMFTSREWASVNAEVAETSQLPAVSKLFDEALASIYLTPEFLRKEKEVIFSEIQEVLNKNPYRNASRQILRAITQSSPWSYSNFGEVDQMMNLTTSDIEDFFSKYYVVENMLLVVAGGCKMSDIEEQFSKINFLHGTRAVLPESPKVVNNQRFFQVLDVSQTELSVGFKGPNPNTRESHVLNFAIFFAHDGLDSRFYRSIRGDKSLAYSLSGNMLVLNRTKYFGTVLSVPGAKIDETIDTVLDCYQNFASEGMTQKEIDGKNETAWFSVKRNMERSFDWVEKFDNFLFENESINTVFGEFPGVYNFRKSITVDEIDAVLKKYITPESFNLHVVGKEPSKKYF